MALILPVNRGAGLPCITILCAVLLLFPPACSNRHMRENEQLRDEIIRVHDTAMEKLGHMFELQNQLQDNSVAGRSNEAADAVAALQEANRAMFDWMHQYQTLAIAENIEKDTAYRHGQLARIREVQRLTDTAIEQAEKLLAASNPRQQATEKERSP